MILNVELVLPSIVGQLVFEERGSNEGSMKYTMMMIPSINHSAIRVWLSDPPPDMLLSDIPADINHFAFSITVSSS